MPKQQLAAHVGAILIYAHRIRLPCRAVRALLGISICCAFLYVASGAGAEVLFEQPAGHGAVPSYRSDAEHYSEAAEDFAVPIGEHWQLTELRIPNAAPVSRRFDVQIAESSSQLGTDEGGYLSRKPLFHETGVVLTGPEYRVPLTGMPVLPHGGYWVSVVAEEPETSEPWKWPTSATSTGEPALQQTFGVEGCGWFQPRAQCFPETAGEPGQALVLEGTRYQILSTGNYGLSDPVTVGPIGAVCASCEVVPERGGPPCLSCQDVIPKGTVVTLTANVIHSSDEFTGWIRHAPMNAPITLPITPVAPDDLPCLPVDESRIEHSCTFAMNEDIDLQAKFFWSNQFLVESLTQEPSAGTATLTVRFPNAGEAELSGPGIASWKPQQRTAIVEHIPIVPQGSVREKLQRTGRAQVTVQLRFFPPHENADGVQRTESRQLTLFQNRSRRRHRHHHRRHHHRHRHHAHHRDRAHR